MHAAAGDLATPDERSVKVKVATVEQYAATWERTIDSSHLKLSTRLSYKSNLKHHIVPELGHLPLTEVDYAVLKDFIMNKLAADYKKDTVRLMIATLRAMLGEAVLEKKIPINPVLGLSKFYAKKRGQRALKRTEVFTIDELYRIEDKIAERFPDYHAFVLTMSRAGLRIGEALALYRTDLDYNRRQILIERNIPAGHGELEDSTKTESSSRSVDMSDDLYDALRRHEKRRAELWLKKGQPVPMFLFTNSEGKPFDYSNFVERVWNKAQKEAKVRQRSPHTLRHTWASQMLASGEDLSWVSQQLGHASPAVTLEIYIHFIPGRRHGKSNALDRSRNKAQEAIQDANGTQMKADSEKRKKNGDAKSLNQWSQRPDLEPGTY